MKPSFAQALATSFLILVVVALVSVLFISSRHPATTPTPLKTPLAVQAQSTTTATNLAIPSASVTRTNATQPPARITGELPNYPDFQERPFPVAYESPHFQWTMGDGKDTNIIRKLAHNELEYRRMVLENQGIYARQLIYHTSPFTEQAEQAVQSGQSIQQITLPGLDGQELQAVVIRTDLKDGGSRGTFYGQLPGDPNSMVTVAFVNDREAFTVNSPLNQIYLLGEAREPGEIVVKSINPALYGRPMN